MGSHVSPLYLESYLFLWSISLPLFLLSSPISSSLSTLPLSIPFYVFLLPIYLPFSIFLRTTLLLFSVFFSYTFSIMLSLFHTFFSLSLSLPLFPSCILSCFPSRVTSSRTKPWLLQARRREKPCARLMALRGYHGNPNPIESPRPAESPFILEKHYKNASLDTLLPLRLANTQTIFCEKCIYRYVRVEACSHMCSLYRLSRWEKYHVKSDIIVRSVLRIHSIVDSIGSFTLLPYINAKMHSFFSLTL